MLVGFSAELIKYLGDWLHTEESKRYGQDRPRKMQYNEAGANVGIFLARQARNGADHSYTDEQCAEDKYIAPLSPF